MNGVFDRDLAVSSQIISEAEFRAGPELIRTLNVAPPVVDGQVRVVTIAGFDTRACGGTHVHATRETGRAKGKDNQRFYWDPV